MTQSTLFNADQVQSFLANHWQQMPAHFPQLIPEVTTLAADELAGLSCEEGVVSSLVKRDQGQLVRSFGPFDEDSFSTLPERGWVLGADHVDLWDPETFALCNRFDFLPNWRFLGASLHFYAGIEFPAHFSYDDQFLIVVDGSLKVDVGSPCSHYSERVEGTKIDELLDSELGDVTSYSLQPGDVLYIPTAQGTRFDASTNALVLSVKYGVPSDAALLRDLAVHTDELLGPDFRLIDETTRTAASNPSQITEGDLSAVANRLERLINDKAFFAHWFGSFITDMSDVQLAPASDRLELFNEDGDYLYRDPVTRLGYFRSSDELSYFCNGHAETLSLAYLPIVEALCANSPLAVDSIGALLSSDEQADWLQTQIEEGHFYVA